MRSMKAQNCVNPAITCRAQARAYGRWQSWFETTYSGDAAYKARQKIETLAAYVPARWMKVIAKAWK